MFVFVCFVCVFSRTFAFFCVCVFLRTSPKGPHSPTLLSDVTPRCSKNCRGNTRSLSTGPAPELHKALPRSLLANTRCHAQRNSASPLKKDVQGIPTRSGSWIHRTLDSKIAPPPKRGSSVPLRKPAPNNFPMSPLGCPKFKQFSMLENLPRQLSIFGQLPWERFNAGLH